MFKQLLGDRVLVKPDETIEQTPGGIILPDIAQTKPLRGTIAAVADGIDDVAIGDTVLYSKYGGAFLNLDDEEYLLLSIDNIYAVEVADPA